MTISFATLPDAARLEISQRLRAAAAERHHHRPRRTRTTFPMRRVAPRS